MGSRRKGHNFERRLARWLREDLSLGDFWRVTEETQQGNVGDVRDRSGSSPLVFQVKKGRRPSPWKAIQEAEEAATDEEVPVAVVHRDQTSPGKGAEQLVIIRPEVFATLVRSAVVTTMATMTRNAPSL